MTKSYRNSAIAQITLLELTRIKLQVNPYNSLYRGRVKLKKFKEMEANEALCSILIKLGYNDVVESYREVEKSYE